MTVNVELMLACDLKSDTPDQVIETLKYLTRKEDYEFDNPPSHPFFESESDYIPHQFWRFIFQQYDLQEANPVLVFFPGLGVCEFYRDESEHIVQNKLTVRALTGPYGDFINAYLPFLDWLGPYINTNEYGDFIGYIHGENTRTGSGHVPVLLFCEEGKIYFSELSQSRAELNENNLTRLFYGKDV